MSKLSRRSNTFTFGYIFLGAALVLGACHGKKSKGSTADDTPCTTAAACDGTQICDPGTSKCVDTLACTTHDQCGTAAYCDTAAGQCVKSVAGQQNPCSAAANCAGTELCAAGHCGCGGQEAVATKVRPNLLLVLDRSMSMTDALDGDTPSPPERKSKWALAKEAVESLTTDDSFKDQIRFGLALYPATTLDTCPVKNGTPGGLMVVPSDDASAIMTALNAAVNCSGTPIGGTLNALRTSPLATQWQDPARSSSILLITDGAENRNDDEVDPLYPVTQAGLFYAQTPQIKTYVIGFQATNSNCNEDCLNTTMLNGIAAAGGTNEFKLATDLETLKTAFTTIAGNALSCDYKLETTPPDENKIYVYQTVGGIITPISNDNWEYNNVTTTVHIKDSFCDTLKSSADLVQISFGCPAGSMGG